MNLNVCLYATLKDRVGASQISVKVNDSATVSDVLSSLTRQHPSLQPALQRILIAVNQEYAERSQSIFPDGEIALFPPVSGG